MACESKGDPFLLARSPGYFYVLAGNQTNLLFNSVSTENDLSWAVADLRIPR